MVSDADRLVAVRGVTLYDMGDNVMVMLPCNKTGKTVTYVVSRHSINAADGTILLPRWLCDNIGIDYEEVDDGG